jgi:hypothetical protein
VGRQRCVEQFIDAFFADHSNGRLVITSRMGADKEAHDRSCRSEWHRQTVVEIANGSAFRMGHLYVRRGLESGLDLGEIKPAILLAPSNHPTLVREDLIDRGLVPIQSVDAHDDLAEGKRTRRRIRRDGLERLSQFCEGFRRFPGLKRCQSIDACTVVTPWSWFAPPVLVCAPNSLWRIPDQNGGEGQEGLLSGEVPAVVRPVWSHRYRPGTSDVPDDPTARLQESRTGFWPQDRPETRTVAPLHSADQVLRESGRGCCDGADGFARRVP